MNKSLKEVINESIIKVRTYKTSLMMNTNIMLAKDDVIKVIEDLKESIDNIDNICKERNRY